MRSGKNSVLTWTIYLTVFTTVVALCNSHFWKARVGGAGQVRFYLLDVWYCIPLANCNTAGAPILQSIALFAIQHSSRDFVTLEGFWQSFVSTADQPLTVITITIMPMEIDIRYGMMIGYLSIELIRSALTWPLLNNYYISFFRFSQAHHSATAVPPYLHVAYI